MTSEKCFPQERNKNNGDGRAKGKTENRGAFNTASQEGGSGKMHTDPGKGGNAEPKRIFNIAFILIKLKINLKNPMQTLASLWRLPETLFSEEKGMKT